MSIVSGDCMSGIFMVGFCSYFFTPNLTSYGQSKGLKSAKKSLCSMGKGIAFGMSKLNPLIIKI